MINALMKSVLEQDRSPIVLCDLNHTIVYMNPTAAKRYEKQGGWELVGKSLKACHNEKSNAMIDKIIDWFKDSKSNNMICTFKNMTENKDVYMVALRDESGNVIGYYEKHEYRTPESANVYDFSQSLI